MIASVIYTLIYRFYFFQLAILFLVENNLLINWPIPCHFVCWCWSKPRWPPPVGKSVWGQISESLRYMGISTHFLFSIEMLFLLFFPLDFTYTHTHVLPLRFALPLRGDAHY